MGTDLKQNAALRTLALVFVCLLVLALFPLTTDPCGDIKYLLISVFAFLALLVWLFAPSESPRCSGTSILLPLILGYALLNLVSCFTSVNPGYSLTHDFSRLLAFLVLFFVGAKAFNAPAHVWTLFKTLAVVVSVSSLYGFLQFAHLDPVPWVDTLGMLSTAPATFGNPNYASHFLAPCVIFACALILRPSSRWALICLCIFGLHFTLTRTRGSILGLAAALALLVIAAFIFRKVKNPHTATASTLLVLLVLAGTAIGAIAALSEHKYGFPVPADGNLAYRMHSFDEACRMIQDKPWLGHGPGMYEVASPPYWNQLEQELFTSRDLTNAHVHNEPLEIAVDSGLPSAVLYLAILIVGIYYGLALWATSTDRDRRLLGLTLAAFFVAFLVDGVFGFNVHVPASAALLFIMVGVTHGLWASSQTAATAPAPPRPWPLPARAAMAVCAALLPILALAEFGSSFFHQRGMGALEYKAFDAAQGCFRTAATLAPFTWSHYYCEGLALQAEQKPADAIACHKRALELNPNFVRARIELAKAMLDAGGSQPERVQEAMQYAQKGADISPLLPDIQDILGRACLAQAQLAVNNGEDPKQAARAAQEHLARAIELGSRNKQKLYQLIAIALLAEDDTNGALKNLAAASKEKPDDAATWKIFLQVSQKTGQYDALMCSIDRALPELGGEKKDEAFADLAVMRATIVYEVYADTDDAQKTFEKAIEKAPASEDLWAAYFAFADKSGTTQQFLDLFAATVTKKNIKPETFRPLIRSAFEATINGQDGITTAVSNLKAILSDMQAQSVPPETVSQRLAWAVFIIAKRAQQTTLAPEKAGDAFLNLGLIYGAMTQFEKALPLFDTALTNLTGKAQIACLLRKGDALTRLNQTKDALETVKKAAEAAPAAFEVRFALAQAYAKDGQKDKARFEYSTILQTFQLNETGVRTVQERLNELSQ